MADQIDKAQKIAEGLNDYQLLDRKTIQQLNQTELLLIDILKKGPVEKELLVDEVVESLRTKGIIEIENEEIKLKHEHIVCII